MRKTLYGVFGAALFLLVTVPQAHASLISSQPDFSGTPSHYWQSDGGSGAYIALDPNDGQPGYSIGVVTPSDTNLVAIHLKLLIRGSGIDTLPRIPLLYDESGAHMYACAQMPFGGNAYGTALDAMNMTNALSFNDWNNKLVDMYFQCYLGVGHDQLYGGTHYRLFLSPISVANVYDIYTAMNAAGTEPYYELSDDGTFPPPPPPIAITVPAPNNTYLTTDTIIPQATIQNLSSYTTVTYLLNGTAIDPTQPLPMSTLPSGTTTLVIAATDSTGNTTYATSTFMVVNSQPPAVTIASPINGHSYLQNDYVAISDTVTNVNPLATTTYLLNGAPVDPNAQLPLMSGSLGTQTLVIAATDIYGNVGYATSTFTVLPPDLTAPTVTITNPIAGATYTDASNVYLTATITDASSISATSYTFNGVSIDPTQPLPLLGAPLGPATVSVAATDAYGNAASSTVTFTIKSSDVIPPTITITNPISGHSYLSTASVLAAATITDTSGVATSSFTLDGMQFDPSKPMPLSLVSTGPATMTVFATDNFGNVASSTVSFTITAPPPPDTQGPSIVFISPTAGKKYARNDSVYVITAITDPAGIASVRYLFNGKSFDPSKPLQLASAPLGNATVTAIATDKFGNTSTASVTFRVMPSSNSCIVDITEAFDHKWISNKNDFKEAFEDCQKINDRGHDRDDYDNDDRHHNRDSHDDPRWQKACKDVDDSFSDIDRRIKN